MCAYEGEEEYWQHALDHSISLQEFLARKSSLRKGTPIVFYCVCPHDEAAVGQARIHLREGFVRSYVMAGGANAWKAAGFPSHAFACNLADVALLSLWDTAAPMPL